MSLEVLHLRGGGLREREADLPRLDPPPLDPRGGLRLRLLESLQHTRRDDEHRPKRVRN